jgi:WD40 repeat protein
MDEGRAPDPGRPAADGEPIEDGVGEPQNDGTVDAEAPMFVPTEEVALEPRAPSRVMVAIAVILITAMGIFALLGGRILAPREPEPTPQPEPLLAVTDGDGRLFTMDPDGGSVVEYKAPDERQFGFPAWSPDGSRIAVTGSGADGIRLYRFDRGRDAESSGEPAILYDERGQPPFYLYWSPDGRQIGFLTQQPDEIALRLVPADGSAEARIVRKGAPLYWDWVGNDRLVTHIGSSGAGSFLGEVDLKGDSTETETLDAGFFRSPAVSRDGSLRAYVTTGQDSPGMVTLESTDGSNRRQAPVFGTAAVSFDPSGRTLAYVASEQRSAEDLQFPLGPLKELDPGSGKTRTLLPGDVVAFYWSPDGTTIAALMLPPADDEIVGVPGARVASVRIGPDEADRPLPNQGIPLTLVFVDVASGAIESSREVDLTTRYVNNILPYYDQYALSHRTWSPDSSAIALPLDAEGDDRLFVIPADGSEMTQLGDAELGFWSP